jgi:hypothetical protein
VKGRERDREQEADRQTGREETGAERREYGGLKKAKGLNNEAR